MEMLPAHLLFAYMLFAEPWLGVLFYRRLQTRLVADPRARAGYYRLLLGWEWAWVPAVAFAVLATGAGPQAIGLRWPNEDGWLITGLMVASMVVSTGLILFVPTVKKQIASQASRAAALLPATAEERLLFAAVSVTAGICEELLYRGFLGFYLNAVFPSLPLWAVILASGLIFGNAHVYQGKAAILSTGLFGAAMYFVYWYSGSLLSAIIAHALADLRTILVAPAGPTDQTVQRH